MIVKVRGFGTIRVSEASHFRHNFAEVHFILR